MFKLLVLEAFYNLSDDQAEFQLQDPLSFMRFVGLGLSERVPDANTIWLCDLLVHMTEVSAVLQRGPQKAPRDHGIDTAAVPEAFSAMFREHLGQAGPRPRTTPNRTPPSTVISPRAGAFL